MKGGATTAKGMPVSQEHQDQVEALGNEIAALLNNSGRTAPVMLDALFNVYLIAAETHGQTQRIAEFMVQVGGSLLIKDALQRQAAGLDPFESPTHH